MCSVEASINELDKTNTFVKQRRIIFNKDVEGSPDIVATHLPSRCCCCRKNSFNSSEAISFDDDNHVKDTSTFTRHVS